MSGAYINKYKLSNLYEQYDVPHELPKAIIVLKKSLKKKI